MITCKSTAQPLDAPGQLPVIFRFDEAAPLEVSLTFVNHEGAVTWVFGRDLLNLGSLRVAGVGDVTFYPNDDDTIDIGLSSPHGTGVFQLVKDDVLRFLVQIYTAVPEGEELPTILNEVDNLIADIRENGTSRD